MRGLRTTMTRAGGAAPPLPRGRVATAGRRGGTRRRPQSLTTRCVQAWFCGACRAAAEAGCVAAGAAAAAPDDQVLVDSSRAPKGWERVLRLSRGPGLGQQARRV